MVHLTGLALADDGTARAIESREVPVGCVEVTADGFFARPSPYLTWLGHEVPLVVRAPGLLDEATLPAAARSLAGVCAAARARLLCLPLATSAVGGMKLPRPLAMPLGTGARSALAATLSYIKASVALPLLIEPVAAPLRLTNALDEPAALAGICDQVGCRLLIDVTALAEDGLRHGFDALGWLRAVPAGLVAGARIHTAPPLGDSEEAWALLDALCARTSLDIVLLDAGPSATRHRLVAELGRLRALPAGQRPRPPLVGAPTTAAAPQRLDGPLPQAECLPAPVATPTLYEPPRLASHLSLHVLDTEGVCFDAARHELSLLNTTATFVWCLLEGGDAPATVAAKYAETFQVDPQVAQCHVGTVLRDWYGRGFISTPGLLPAAPLPLVTAAAMVVTNPSLRTAFRRDASAVADYLRVVPGDRAAFVALAPDALDAQAADVDADEGESTASGPAETAHPEPDSASLVGHFALLSTTFGVYADDAGTRAALGQTLGHLAASGDADVVLEVRDRTRLFEDGALLFDVRHPQAVVPAVKQRLRAVAAERRPWAMTVHAGVVAFGDDCVLLPAAPGSGKTTLVAALVHAGATYYSDEIAPLERDTLAVVPAPLALTIKDGSVGPLGRLFPGIDEIIPHVREDHVRVRYLPPPEARLPRPGATARARALVFPRYDPDGMTALTPIARPLALRRLLDESSLDPRMFDAAAVAALVGWMRELECYELTLSSSQEAADLVQRLVAVWNPHR